MPDFYVEFYQVPFDYARGEQLNEGWTEPLLDVYPHPKSLEEAMRAVRENAGDALAMCDVDSVGPFSSFGCDLCAVISEDVYDEDIDDYEVAEVDRVTVRGHDDESLRDVISDYAYSLESLLPDHPEVEMSSAPRSFETFYVMWDVLGDDDHEAVSEDGSTTPYCKVRVSAHDSKPGFHDESTKCIWLDEYNDVDSLTDAILSAYEHWMGEVSDILSSSSTTAPRRATASASGWRCSITDIAPNYADGYMSRSGFGDVQVKVRDVGRDEAPDQFGTYGFHATVTYYIPDEDRPWKSAWEHKERICWNQNGRQTKTPSLILFDRDQKQDKSGYDGTGLASIIPLIIKDDVVAEMERNAKLNISRDDRAVRSLSACKNASMHKIGRRHGMRSSARGDYLMLNEDGCGGYTGGTDAYDVDVFETDDCDWCWEVYKDGEYVDSGRCSGANAAVREVCRKLDVELAPTVKMSNASTSGRYQQHYKYEDADGFVIIAPDGSIGMPRFVTNGAYLDAFLMDFDDGDEDRLGRLLTLEEEVLTNGYGECSDPNLVAYAVSKKAWLPKTSKINRHLSSSTSAPNTTDGLRAARKARRTLASGTRRQAEARTVCRDFGDVSVTITNERGRGSILVELATPDNWYSRSFRDVDGADADDIAGMVLELADKYGVDMSGVADDDLKALCSEAAMRSDVTSSRIRNARRRMGHGIARPCRRHAACRGKVAAMYDIPREFGGGYVEARQLGSGKWQAVAVQDGEYATQRLYADTERGAVRMVVDDMQAYPAANGMTVDDVMGGRSGRRSMRGRAMASRPRGMTCAAPDGFATMPRVPGDVPSASVRESCPLCHSAEFDGSYCPTCGFHRSDSPSSTAVGGSGSGRRTLIDLTCAGSGCGGGGKRRRNRR